jgi:hypothetical protein
MKNRLSSNHARRAAKGLLLVLGAFGIVTFFPGCVGHHARVDNRMDRRDDRQDIRYDRRDDRQDIRYDRRDYRMDRRQARWY